MWLRRSGWISFAVSLLTSLILILFLLWKVDLRVFLHALFNVRWPFLLIGLLLYPLAPTICAVKWRYLARALGINKQLKPMLGLYFIGMFFNLFLPNVIGGDVTRGIYFAPGSSNRKNALLSIVVERASGVVSMIFLASAAMLSPHGAVLPEWLRYGFPILSILGFTVFAFFPIFLQNTRTRLSRLVSDDLSIFWREPRISFTALFYSMLAHLVLIGIHFCIVRALNLNVPIVYLFIAMPLASLAAMIPSLNGIGVRDAAYIYIFSFVLVEPSYALAFSFLWLLITSCSSMIGCLVYVVWRVAPRTLKPLNP
jgi:glycosyltransferase 2 family protein